MVIVDAASGVVGEHGAALHAVGDGQAGNGNGIARGNVEHAAGGVAIDGDVGRAGAQDVQILGNEQFAVGQSDGAVGARDEHDGVLTGATICVRHRDGVTETAGTAVAGCCNNEGER